MREIVSIHIGQAGINVGLDTWSLIEKEYAYIQNYSKHEEDSYEPIYHFRDKKPHEPRAIFVDTDCSSINDIESKRLLSPFNPSRNILNSFDTEGVPFSYGPEAGELQAELMEKFRKEFEGSDRPEGVLVYAGAAGGTGCGVTIKLLQTLSDESSKISVMCFPIFSKFKLSQSYLEAYNNILMVNSLVEQSSVNILFDNNSVRRIRKENLKTWSHSYNQLNSLIAYQIFNLTRGMRSVKYCLENIADIMSGFVPYPRINLLASSINKIYPKNYEAIENCQHPGATTVEAVLKNNQFFGTDMTRGNLMAAGVYYNSMAMAPKDVGPALCK